MKTKLKILKALLRAIPFGAVMIAWCKCGVVPV